MFMLFNGCCMVYGGFMQVVDISVILVEVVECIEIVFDGVLVIYGFDVVGGVGNVIFKCDFDDVIVGMCFGRVMQGGFISCEYNIIVGIIWCSGGFIVMYMDILVDFIYSSQCSYIEQLVDFVMLYLGSDLYSGLFSVYQLLGDVVELCLDVLCIMCSQWYMYNYVGISI